MDEPPAPSEADDLRALLAACQMRRVLVDHARARNAGKRPGQFTRLPLEAIRELGEGPDEDLLALDEALSALAGVDWDSR